MRNPWASVLAGLFALTLLPFATAEEVAALPNESPAAGDSGAPRYTLTGDVGGGREAGGAGVEAGASDAGWIRVRAHVLYDAFKDLTIAKRTIKRNDLGLSFAQPTLTAQNDAEQKSWDETTEMVEVLFNPFYGSPQAVWVFIGAGARQSNLDFGTGSVDLKGPPINVYSAGLQLDLGEATPGVRLDLEGRFTYSSSKDGSVDEVPDVNEELDTEILIYTARLVAVFDPALLEPCSNLGGIRLQPYLGVLFQYLDGQETYRASSTSGVVGESEFEFDIRSRAASSVRALGGLRLLGLEETASVDVEGSVGYGSYGAGLVVNIWF